MKELSIEEKAKAYDETLEKARLVLQERGNEPDGASILSELFPELKESEDEKIRKEILNYIIKGSESCYDVQKYGKGKFEKWIAWLEKQGEHANFRNKIQIGDKVTRNEDGVLVNLSQLNRVTKVDEKQGEQKPWSEEDEMFVHGLIRGLVAKRDIHGHTTFSSDCIDITETINWLESLKDRVQTQNKCKESLATADLENSLCDIQDGFSDTSYEYRILGEAIEFIRCTEPKPQWKPSDEQLFDLKGIAKQNEHNMLGKSLMSLYNDLLKLKG